MRSHVATNSAVGLSKRTARVRRNLRTPPPLRAARLRYATKFAKPPTKKKIGMTWKTQVASHRPEVTPIALWTPMIPPVQKMMPMNQWPNTTATMLAARRKST